MDYSNITEVDLSSKGLTKLPDLSIYTNLKKLNCSTNKLTTLYNLRQTIEKLYCSGNKITSPDNLPPTITEFNNHITKLDIDNPPYFNYIFKLL